MYLSKSPSHPPLAVGSSLFFIDMTKHSHYSATVVSQQPLPFKRTGYSRLRPHSFSQRKRRFAWQFFFYFVYASVERAKKPVL